MCQNILEGKTSTKKIQNINFSQFLNVSENFYRKFQISFDRSVRVLTGPKRFWSDFFQNLFFEKFFVNYVSYFEIRKFFHTILIFWMTTFFGDQPKTGHFQILPSPKTIILVKNRMFLENYF